MSPPRPTGTRSARIPPAICAGSSWLPYAQPDIGETPASARALAPIADRSTQAKAHSGMQQGNDASRLKHEPLGGVKILGRICAEVRAPNSDRRLKGRERDRAIERAAGGANQSQVGRGGIGE